MSPIKSYTLTFIFFLFSLLSFGQQNEFQTSGDEYYSNQDYENAFTSFKKCYETDSLNVKCLQSAGLSAYRLGDIPEARKLFLELIKTDSTNRIGLTQLATIFEQSKNTPKAIKYYNQLTKIFPDNAVFYRKLAQQYQGAGLMTEAFTNYLKANALNKRDLFTIKGLAELFITNKQYSEADSMLLEGLRMDTFNINLHFLMAQSKYKQKSYDSTVHYLTNIIGRIDFSPYYNKMLGYSYIQIDSFEKSIPILFKALNDPGSAENAHYYLATAYNELDNKPYAKHHYEKALEEGISGNVDIYHRVLAKMYNEENQLSKAIDHYKDAYKYGKDPLVLFYLARAADVYYKDKNIAINYYKKYYKSNHSNKEYVTYAKERARQLKEVQHQSRAQSN